MQTFGFVLAVGLSGVAAAPTCAAPLTVSPDLSGRSVLQPAAYDGDAPMPGRHRGARKSRGPSAKAVDPAVPSMKGVSQEDADKKYKSKYGF